ncbi:phosphoadenylyl-sulfate reductase [Aurantiacibacter zhengii]|uniref:Adenosine 5'-phosphosulfate reductase n=1 Tax=Aurantiacibacter zhengii TaxID=2307003 RepID=A0A418NUZ1_9SPHN|nr:phosphoadenylyl-sulfate reductase [Aurantiacibacter zhengii]RIV87829.1 phosphoadenylyl-sulfate reductase [Aurantiacibacter zhengii]
MAEAARRTDRNVDRIDTAPAFTQADADALSARFEGVAADELLRTLLHEDGLGRVGVVSSFGTEAVVLLHLVARANKDVPIIFVDTLKMFDETLKYREQVIALLGFTNTSVVRPDPDVLKAKDETGMRWSYDPDGCCEIRKVEPMNRAKASLDSWISGRKAFQSHTRQNLPRFEVEKGRMKVNPLGDWTKEDLDAYFEEHDLPRHPMEAMGYPSVGCSPCTSTVLPGEDSRAGRWRGWDKTECGIHSTTVPKGEGGDLPPGYEPFL